MKEFFVDGVTARGIAHLAGKTGRDERLVIRDAIRTYAWIVDHQLSGEIIAALAPADVRHLESAPGLNGSRACLVSYVAPAPPAAPAQGAP